MSNYQTLKYDLNNGVATIVLNRPDVSNAIDDQMQRELLAAVQRVADDSQVRVVIITGEGKNFSAGADLASTRQTAERKASDILNEVVKPLLMTIYNTRKPFISAINGVAAGVGSALAMVCDLTVMADDACIYQAFVNVGLIPDGGASWHLVQQLGYRRAYEMVIEGEKMPADTCLQLGLANAVVPADSLLEYTQNWGQRLSKKAPLALGYSKEALQMALLMDLSDTIDIEGKIQNVVADSADAEEGIGAFLERRTPVFQGR
ncbi:enoyl-CoA hydratase/isomerase family protein [Pseudomaricurvus alkylphenolicus]|uniref:enoyl-CoA hydratase/isomerase family protein n=1 Tax=Pseudomaricurvus alkylphenolicus TaxID=1306991 RepID=UPI00141EE8B8|nr:enoyl-CoA hydratase/isomerase family protein [Pseudomaricurvus alkylphenolicus]NIB41694.1 enoyl-CoA hydratase/isomerase family protein [Pseudomaricurvus alkylphenolicus]